MMSIIYIVILSIWYSSTSKKIVPLKSVEVEIPLNIIKACIKAYGYHQILEFWKVIPEFFTWDPIFCCQGAQYHLKTIHWARNTEN